MKAHVPAVVWQRWALFAVNSGLSVGPTMAAIVLLWAATAASAQNAESYPLGDIPMPPELYAQELVLPPDASEALPGSYDARSRGIVTPPKDQGSCGSCWAFAAVAALESHLLALSATDATDLSEQQQVSCNTDQFGCSGGYLWCVRFWEARGPVAESCFGYTARDSTPCSSSCDELAYRIVNYHTVERTTGGFKASCFNQGPSSWRFDVYADFFTYWKAGSPGQVYRNTWGAIRGGHAVLLIGWDDAKGAFLCKNSWGATGGPNRDGTFWIAYTNHVHDLGFGMVNFEIAAAGLPTINTLAINGGAASTTNRVVRLNNRCTGDPTEYMASESSSFSGAAWQSYSDAPAFTLSSGSATKHVYFKVRNAIGASGAVTRTIHYSEPSLPLVYVDWRYTSPDADGSQARPYPRVAEGYARLPEHGLLWVRAGAYAETVSFDRPGRLTRDESVPGVVQVGQVPTQWNETPPTAARLDYFRAVRDGSGDVLVGWGTLVELRTLGFRLERAVEEGDWQPLTTPLIPALGADALAHAYRFTDVAAAWPLATKYRLIEVDLRGLESVLAEATVAPAVMLAVERSAPGLCLRVRGLPNGKVVIESASTVAGPWSEWTRVSLNESGVAAMALKSESAEPVRFYRVLSE